MANTARRTWLYASSHLPKVNFSTIGYPLFFHLQKSITSTDNRRRRDVLDQQRSFCSMQNDPAELLCRSVEDVRQRCCTLAEDIGKTRAKLSCRASEGWMIQEQIAHLWQQHSFISEQVSKIETGVVPRLLAKGAGRIDEQRLARLAEDAMNVRKELETRFDNEIAQITDQFWARAREGEKDATF